MLAVGSDLRGDDAAGPLVAKHLKELGRRGAPRLKVFLGGTAPENLTGEIKQYRPTHLVVVDSAEFGAKPGGVAVMALSDAIGGPTFSSHSLPLTIMLQYLLHFIECEVVILGIQPRRLSFGASPSKSVDLSARRVAKAIHSSLAGA